MYKRQRIDREFHLDIITTSPSVIYKLHLTNGKEMDLSNPTNMPDPSTIDYLEEPIVEARIMTPNDYVGAIMELCQERRGQYTNMEYVEENRVILQYTLPLNEIIYDLSLIHI